MFKQPTTYSEMLSRLNWITAALTFVYTAILTRLGLLPYIAIAKNLSPPVDIPGSKGFVSWAAAVFGAVPLLCAVVAFALSRAFEVHNLLSKALQIRYVWDKYYIVKPLRSRANSDVPLDRETVRKVMNEFYYDEVKRIDPHYMHLFWRYALPFWVIFEHSVVIVISIVILWFRGAPHVLTVAGYLLFVLVVGALHFQFIATKKTRDQVRQIPTVNIETYFGGLQRIARV